MPLILFMGTPVDGRSRMAAQLSPVARWLSHISCFQLCAFSLAILGFIMGIASTVDVQWRVWHVQGSTNSSSATVWIGIWEVCIKPHAIPSEESCQELNETHGSIPKEIDTAWDLMSSATILNALAVSSMAFALYNVLKPMKGETFIVTFFFLAAGLDFTSGIFVLISVSWNMLRVLQGEGVKLPKIFKLPEVPKHQYVGRAIYVGYAAAAVQLLSAVLIFYEMCLLKRIKPCLSETVVIHETKTTAIKSETLMSCPNCGSAATTDLTVLNQSSTFKSYGNFVTVPNAFESAARRPVIVVTPSGNEKIIEF